MFKIIGALLIAVFAFSLTTIQAEAKSHHRMHRVAVPPAVVAHVSIGEQRLYLTVEGQPYAAWPISSARAGYHTPRGAYGATRMARVYYSKKYDNSPMPNSVFFYGGYAIHGTYHVAGLGHPASHGCVRLAPANAAQLYSLVEQFGMGRTRIIID
jgi:lipoprotein-anchoring transpeptidase ErfK/SrfK